MASAVSDFSLRTKSAAGDDISSVPTSSAIQNDVLLQYKSKKSTHQADGAVCSEPVPLLILSKMAKHSSAISMKRSAMLLRPMPRRYHVHRSSPFNKMHQIEIIPAITDDRSASSEDKHLHPAAFGVATAYDAGDSNTDRLPCPCTTCRIPSRFRTVGSGRRPSNLAAVPCVLERNKNSERPSCRVCQKPFAHKSSLKSHLLRHHQTTKKFQCNTCCKVFGEKFDLRRHIRTVHINSRPLSCPHCSRRFAFPSKLAEHVRTHTGEKPFRCGSCNFTSATRGNLDRHAKSHNS